MTQLDMDMAHLAMWYIRAMRSPGKVTTKSVRWTESGDKTQTATWQRPQNDAMWHLTGRDIDTTLPSSSHWPDTTPMPSSKSSSDMSLSLRPRVETGGDRWLFLMSYGSWLTFCEPHKDQQSFTSASNSNGNNKERAVRTTSISGL